MSVTYELFERGQIHLIRNLWEKLNQVHLGDEGFYWGIIAPSGHSGRSRRLVQYRCG